MGVSLGLFGGRGGNGRGIYLAIMICDSLSEVREWERDCRSVMRSESFWKTVVFGIKDDKAVPRLCFVTLKRSRQYNVP